ncbi:unnamed protein product [Pleuronectes platessa]|uniref:Uncharacterized protein n=1 Tax=Pleuronectes platessa TaxID=8262 RepID=A0A9N7Y3S2_PLEPL|nr:unnamed protein product [Pleuronectes platessa]
MAEDAALHTWLQSAHHSSLMSSPAGQSCNALQCINPASSTTLHQFVVLDHPFSNQPQICLSSSKGLQHRPRISSLLPPNRTLVLFAVNNLLNLFSCLSRTFVHQSSTGNRLEALTLDSITQ